MTVDQLSSLLERLLSEGLTTHTAVAIVIVIVVLRMRRQGATLTRALLEYWGCKADRQTILARQTRASLLALDLIEKGVESGTVSRIVAATLGSEVGAVQIGESSHDTEARELRARGARAGGPPHYRSWVARFRQVVQAVTRGHEL